MYIVCQHVVKIFILALKRLWGNCPHFPDYCLFSSDLPWQVFTAVPCAPLHLELLLSAFSIKSSSSLYIALFLEMQGPDRQGTGSPFSKLNPLYLTYNRSQGEHAAVTSFFHFLRLQKFLPCSISVIVRHTFYII